MSSIISRVRGQDKMKKTMDSSRSRWPSAFVFYGPEGVGKSLFAQGLIQNELCEKPAPKGYEQDLFSFSCGSCGSCKRLEQKQSENLFWIEPENKVHKIQASREILEFLSLQSISRLPRFVVINEAHLLNAQASNALLKVIEEPPENVYFIFITHKLDSLLPTIRSRTVHFAFQPLTRFILSELVPTAADWALRACRGSVSNLHQILEDETSVRKWSADLLVHWLKNPSAFLDSSWRDEVKTREFAIEVARYFQQFFRDGSVRGVTLNLQNKPLEESLIVHKDQTELLSSLGQLEPHRLKKMFSLSLDLEFALSANRDAVLSFEEFYLKAVRV